MVTEGDRVKSEEFGTGVVYYYIKSNFKILVVFDEPNTLLHEGEFCNKGDPAARTKRSWWYSLEDVENMLTQKEIVTKPVKFEFVCNMTRDQAETMLESIITMGELVGSEIAGGFEFDYREDEDGQS